LFRGEIGEDRRRNELAPGIASLGIGRWRFGHPPGVVHECPDVHAVGLCEENHGFDGRGLYLSALDLAQVGVVDAAARPVLDVSEAPPQLGPELAEVRPEVRSVRACHEADRSLPALLAASTALPTSCGRDALALH